MATFLGMTTANVRNYLKKGTIRGIKTPGGQGRIPESEVQRILKPTGEPISAVTRITCVIYARFSSQKQKTVGHLERQAARLREYADQRQFEVLKVITEVGSGLKENRKGLQQLLRLAATQPIDYVLVEF